MRIINGQVITIEGPVYENGYVEFENGIITGIGEMSEIRACREDFDAGGGYVVPGLIDAHSHLGASEEGNGEESEKTVEATDPITPDVRIWDNIWERDAGFAHGLYGGVTSTIVCPGSVNVFSGQAAHIKLAGNTVDEMIVKAPCAMKMAIGENPKMAQSKCSKKLETCMQNIALARETFISAGIYMEKREKGLAKYDAKLDAVCQVLKKEIPVHFHAHSAPDIMKAIRLSLEFDFRLMIVHGTQGFKIPEYIKKAGVPVICGPYTGTAVKVECEGESSATPGILSRAGIKTCITTDYPVIPLYCLNLSAALAVRDGMDEMEALKAITIYAAEMSGTQDRVGSLKVGKDADIAVFSGHPFDYLASVKAVFINGRRVR